MGQTAKTLQGLVFTGDASQLRVSEFVMDNQPFGGTPCDAVPVTDATRSSECGAGGSKVTDSTNSASSVTEPSATGNVNARLQELIARAEQSALYVGTSRHNKDLLTELCFTIVALAQRIAVLQEAPETPRIVLP